METAVELEGRGVVHVEMDGPDLAPPCRVRFACRPRFEGAERENSLAAGWTGGEPKQAEVVVGAARHAIPVEVGLVLAVLGAGGDPYDSDEVRAMGHLVAVSAVSLAAQGDDDYRDLEF